MMMTESAHPPPNMATHSPTVGGGCAAIGNYRSHVLPITIVQSKVQSVLINLSNSYTGIDWAFK